LSKSTVAVKTPFVVNINLQPEDNTRLARLCGQFDEHIRTIEKTYGVEISHRGHTFRVTGSRKGAYAAGEAIKNLYSEAEEDGAVTAPSVQLYLQSVNASRMFTSTKTPPENQQGPVELIPLKNKAIKPRGKNQQIYVKRIGENDINFGIGPAGTGKTYLAVAKAVEALEQGMVKRIILARPAVEAGERLGFLPGDMAQKIDPYLRPLYDALYEMLGFEHVAKLLERSVIEVAPLAFMRGRTLNDAFVILDEAQNTTTEQMKMFLTRIGFGSKVIVTGDVTQVDLPNARLSGLQNVIEILHGVEGISFTFFEHKDVVRHPLVQRVVAAYEASERKIQNKQ